MIKNTEGESRTMLIIDPLPVGEQAKTLRAQRIPVEALRAGMRTVLADISHMFSDAEAALGRCQLDEIELSLEIRTDGSIALLGTGVTTGATGAIKLKFKIQQPN